MWTSLCRSLLPSPGALSNDSDLSLSLRQLASNVRLQVILAAVAEHERQMISERTRAALQAAKKRGKVLGNPDIGEVAKRGRAVAKANARRFAANVRPIIEEIMRAGATSHNAIAAKLNERNVRTARGGKWTHLQVGAILHPFGGASAAVA